MSRLLFTLLVLATCSLALDAHAAGDAAEGRKRAYTCTGCHGIPGYKNTYPMYSVPRIAGQSETYLVNALNAYRKGERKHATMSAQAMSFSDQDIADIAAYLASAK
jgi:cytochrome c553